MPLYEVETDDAIYEVDAASDEEARQKVRAKLGQAAPAQPSVQLPRAIEHSSSGIGDAIVDTAKGAGRRLGAVAEGLGSLVASPIQKAATALGTGAAAYLDDNPLAQEALSKPSAHLAFSPLSGFEDLAKVGAHSLDRGSEYGGRAVEHAKVGDYTGAALEGTRALFAANPITSASIDSGERLVKSGDFTGLGELAVDAALAGSPTKKARSGIADKGTALREGAHKKVIDTILRPTKKNKALADAAAKEMLERAIVGSPESIGKKAKKLEKKSGKEVQQLWASKPELDFPLAPTKKALQEFAEAKGDFRGTTINADKVKAAGVELEKLDALGDSLKMGEGKPIWDSGGNQGLIQLLEENVPARAYAKGTDPTISARGEASRVAADALRRTGEKLIPGLGKASKDYSFAANLKTLIENRKAGSPSSAPIIKDTLLGTAKGIFDKLAYNPRWTTLSAVVQDRIGKLLEAARPAEALEELQKAGIPKESLVGKGTLPEQELSLPAAAEPDLAAFAEPSVPPLGLDEASSLPRVWGDAPPAGFELPEANLAALEALEAELAQLGVQIPDVAPAGLSTDQLLALQAADQQAIRDALRTINNPTYQGIGAPAAEGFTRLYRGISPNRAGTAQGAYFTPNPKLAELYAEGGPLSTVDVPTAELPNYLPPNPEYIVPPGQELKLGEYILPPELVSKATKASGKTKADVLREIFLRARRRALGGQ